MTKGNKPGYTRKGNYNEPWDEVPVYQLQSYQTGLVQKLSGKITSALIWPAQVMVYHLRDLTYVHPRIISSQEKTLAWKVAFERWSATFGVKINRYDLDNTIFSEKHVWSAILDSNQTIPYFGVGSYHKNAIVKIKIHYLTLGSIKLLLHENIYCPE